MRMQTGLQTQPNQGLPSFKADPLNIQGWMDILELGWLSRQAKIYKSVVEIGAWKGRSTAALLNTCPGTVTVVDHFKGTPSELSTSHFEACYADIYSQFMENVGHFPNLKVLRMDSVEASKEFADQSVEMVFIDADHTHDAVIRDINAWLPKCSRLICGHDSYEVRKALDESGIEWFHGPGLIWFADISRVERDA